MALTRATDSALALDRVETPRGELVLRQDGEHFEVISNGLFLMDTRNGESERALVREALERAHAPGHVLVGGLGVGFSLQEALTDDRVARVTVIEIEPTIVGWQRTHLARLTGGALSDRRAEIVIADLRDHLARTRDRYDAICLDVDNGPDWTVTDANTSLYDDAGTASLAGRLTPGGVLTVWSAAQSPSYERVLRRHFGKVDIIEIAVLRGEPDVVFAATQAVSQTQGCDSDISR
jgi:spermidine synthase